ncbi:hypothetical protein LBMAG53_09170 [Planctomycetota bacterium]|nr:hypothetical protein LBMAG53_09170 [Planctomycetota bacterium]
MGSWRSALPGHPERRTRRTTAEVAIWAAHSQTPVRDEKADSPAMAEPAQRWALDEFPRRLSAIAVPMRSTLTGILLLTLLLDALVTHATT